MKPHTPSTPATRRRWPRARRRLIAGLATGLAATAWLPAAHAAPFSFYSFAVAELKGHGCPTVRLQDVDRGATLGTASASVSGSAAMDCEAPSTNFPWTSYANADTDMMNGELHAVAYAESAPKTANGIITWVQGRTAFADRIQLHGQGSGLGTIRLDLDGVVSTTGDAVFMLSLCMGVSRGDTDPALAMTCRDLDNLQFAGNHEVGVPTELEIDWGLQRVVTVGPEPINLVVGLMGYAASGRIGGRSLVDVGHTAHLTIGLPEGMTFTSESGVLLAGPASPVPEPATALLGLAGLIGLTVGRQRRPQPD